jgi:hypothetical protein
MGTGQKVEGLSIPECPPNPAERRRLEGERECENGGGAEQLREV